MGNEDPWYVFVAGAATLLIFAAVVFIPIRIVVLLVRQRRRDRGD